MALIAALFLAAGFTSFFPSASAETSSQLVTCINFATKSERISHTGKCRITQEAQANWHVLSSDSRLPEKGKSKLISICSNKPTSPVTYQIIRAKCASNQIRTEYFRSNLLNASPTISKVAATGYDSAQVSLANDPTANPDAPVAYYTITSDKGQSKNIFTWGEINLTIDNLTELTTYSFTVTVTTADGTSSISASSNSVKTEKYVAPPAQTTSSAQTISAPVAQVSLLSSDTASVTIPAGVTSVAVSAPTLGNPSLSFGSQAAAISGTISSAANPAGGSSTPFSVSGSTKIVDIAVSGLSGSATVCLDASATSKLWHYVSGAWVDITSSHTLTQVCGLTSSFSPFTGEEQLPAPAFTLSTSPLSGNKDSAITPITATKTAHSQTVTYSVLPTLPSGLSINTSTGTISGTPTATASAADYVITATNAAAGTATRTLAITVNAALTCAQGGACNLGGVGPGGGTVFYQSVDGFNCGPSFSSTGSPTGGLCHYLETRNSDLGLYAICSTSGDNWSVALRAGNSGIGSGYKNTLNQIAALTIRNECLTSNYALPTSRAAFGGYTDWYIPSSEEAFTLVHYVYPSFPTSESPWLAYWTSTQTTSGTGYIVNISTGQTADSWQRDTRLLRPIRAF